MTDTEVAVQQLTAKPKADLEAILADELGDAYPGAITGSLRNDFMRACYARIAANEDPYDRLRDHPNYEPDWGEKKSLATALRMLLTERVGHPEYDGITSLSKPVLAELVVAIREAEGRR